VWEDARDAYLHETLVRKRSSAAALAVIYHGVLQRLLESGAIDFGARIDCRCASFDADCDSRSKLSGFVVQHPVSVAGERLCRRLR
jgi:hypothetical protein